MKTQPVHQPTNQEMLDRVWRHFLVEEKPAGMSSRGGCTYRGDGRCCAIGLFLPDEVFRPAMNDNFVLPLLMNYPKIRAYLSPDREFLRNLQQAHDCAVMAAKKDDLFTPPTLDEEKFRAGLWARLVQVAAGFGLTIPGDGPAVSVPGPSAVDGDF